MLLTRLPCTCPSLTSLAELGLLCCPGQPRSKGAHAHTCCTQTGSREFDSLLTQAVANCYHWLYGCWEDPGCENNFHPAYFKCSQSLWSNKCPLLWGTQCSHCTALPFLSPLVICTNVKASWVSQGLTLVMDLFFFRDSKSSQNLPHFCFLVSTSFCFSFSHFP